LLRWYWFISKVLCFTRNALCEANRMPYAITDPMEQSTDQHLGRRAINKSAFGAVSTLVAALESYDDATGEHAKRVQTLANVVARKLRSSPEEARAVSYATLLHDIGKIGIPVSILNKPTKLDEQEWAIMRRHPEIGADMIRRIAGFDVAAKTVLAHHERHDGSGYPAGLAGREIPVGARLISVVDAYDSMANDRPYRKALTHEQAMAELEAGAGSQFDPKVVEATLEVLAGPRFGTR
jgi:putative nucleotidyltransferase with HDIG domain